VIEKPDIKERGIYTMVCETQGLNAIIFGDSFSGTLSPYFSRYFHRSTYIRKGINHYDSLIKYVEQEKPDIVIEEVVERFLPYIPSSVLFKNTPHHKSEESRITH